MEKGVAVGQSRIIFQPTYQTYDQWDENTQYVRDDMPILSHLCITRSSTAYYKAIIWAVVTVAAAIVGTDCL